jgi:hypothetical protein
VLINKYLLIIASIINGAATQLMQILVVLCDGVIMPADAFDRQFPFFFQLVVRGK